MNHKKSLKLILTSLFIALSIHAVFAESEPCIIETEYPRLLTIPVALDKAATIDGITIKAVFDQNLIEAVGGTLNGGILENKDYELLVNTENAGKITLVIYAKDDLVTEDGIVAFITFRLKEHTSSLITLTSISPLSGGFYVNDAFCQSLTIITECYNITASAINGRINSSEDNQTVSITPDNYYDVNTVQVFSGADRAFAITPDNCYEANKVLVDNAPVTLTNGEYIFRNVTADHTIMVTFKENCTVNGCCMNIRTANLSKITETTAVSGGDIIYDGGESVTERGICWSTSPNPTIADSKTENGSGEGEFIASMTGLSSGTKYYVRAYATNSLYTGYGNQKIFVTIPSAPIAEEASDITETCFIANWGSAKGADFYSLDISETDKFNTGYNKTLSVNGNCKTIGGLIRGKKYFYRVRAVNASGKSENSAIKNVTTKNITSECDMEGDVNCDYSVDMADAILTLKTLTGMCGCGISTGADVNGDKRIGFEELLYILQTISSH